MSKLRPDARSHEQSDLERMFARAEEQREAGNLRSAFRLLLSAAKRGHGASQINLGNFYSDGIGVKPNPAAALYWYRKAYRKGDRSAASNIGVLFRDEKKMREALAWFQRAAKLHDGDANLEIAKIYLQMNEEAQAARYLKRTCDAKRVDVTEYSQEEAMRLLKQMGRD